MATIERPQSFRNKVDEWLYVMRWTTRKSREASPALFNMQAEGFLLDNPRAAG